MNHYLAVIDRYIYIVLEEPKFDEPKIMVLPYPTGIYVNSYIQQVYLDHLQKLDVLSNADGTYTDENGTRWALENYGATTPNESLCLEMTYPKPKGRGEYKYDCGHWRHWTKAHGWKTVYDNWEPHYQPLLKAQSATA